MWLPGEQEVVAIDHSDREVVLPLFRRAKAQAAVLHLVGPPTTDGEDRFEKRHQVRQIHPRDLACYRSEVETRDMADEIADGVHRVVAAERRGLLVEPLVERLPPESGVGVGKHSGEHARRCHPDYEMANVLRIVHRAPESQVDSRQLLVQKIPDSALHRVRIPHRDYIDRVGLAVAAQAPHALMKAHRIPRQIHMNQGATTLLKVDALAGRFGGNEKTNFPPVEPCCRTVSVFRSSRYAAGRILHILDEAVAVDERHASIAVALVQSTHEQRLGRLVLREEEHCPVGERLVDHGEDALDLRLVGYIVCRRQQFLEGWNLVRIEIDSAQGLRHPLFQPTDFVLIGRVVLGQQLLQPHQILARLLQSALRLTETDEPSSKGPSHCRHRTRRQLLHCDQYQDYRAPILGAETGRVGSPSHDELRELLVESSLLRRVGVGFAP